MLATTVVTSIQLNYAGPGSFHSRFAKVSHGSCQFRIWEVWILQRRLDENDGWWLEKALRLISTKQIVIPVTHVNIRNSKSGRQTNLRLRLRNQLSFGKWTTRTAKPVAMFASWMSGFTIYFYRVFWFCPQLLSWTFCWQIQRGLRQNLSSGGRTGTD